MLKVLSFLTHTPENDSSLNFLWNWTETIILMVHFSKLRKYQTFGLIELHNLSQLIEYLSYEKAVFTIAGSSNIQLLKLWFFNFSSFQTTFDQSFMKKLPGFKIDFESTDNFFPLHQWNASTMKQWFFDFFFFLICTEECFTS